MRRRRLAFACSWIVSLALPAAPARAQAPTPAHRLVAGTRVWLVPPAGFGPSAGLTGLRKGEAVVQVMDLAGSNFYQHAAAFNRSRFAGRGARVVDFQELLVQGYPARLVQLEQAGAPSSVQLLFGDSTFAALLVGRYPAADTSAGTALRGALLSAAYAKNQAASAPGGAGVYVLDEQKAGFTRKAVGPARAEYVPAGAAGPALLVSVVPYHPSRTAADIGKEQLQRLLPPAAAGYHARRTSSAPVNDLVTFETEGTARQQGRPVLVFQQVTVVGSSAVVLQGVAPADSSAEARLARFRTLARTIKAAAPLRKP